jgi:hypothetical protein
MQCKECAAWQRPIYRSGCAMCEARMIARFGWPLIDRHLNRLRARKMPEAKVLALRERIIFCLEQEKEFTI